MDIKQKIKVRLKTHLKVGKNQELAEKTVSS